MENDSWRHWRALSALAAPAFGFGGGPVGGSDLGFAPWIHAGERFARAARGFFEAANGAESAGIYGAAPASGGPAAAGSARDAAQAFADFLREQFANVQMPWAAGSTTRDPFAAAGMGSLGHAPALGAAREHQQRSERRADAWRGMEEAQTRLQRLWSDALQEAANAFAADLAGRPLASLDPEALRGLYDRWIDAAEAAYARTAHGETFCRALADFVNASSAWRKEQQASIEQWAKQFDLPSRSELNSLAQRLKAVEAELAAAHAATAGPAATPVPAATTARARKSPQGRRLAVKKKTTPKR
jgi:hypothetical protein